MSDIIKLILQQGDIFITGLMGLSLRIFLSVFDQKWVNTFQFARFSKYCKSITALKINQV